MNQNVAAYEAGARFRLEILATNMARPAPEFTKTKAHASRRLKELKSAGFNVTIFTVRSDGNLDRA